MCNNSGMLIVLAGITGGLALSVEVGSFQAQLPGADCVGLLKEENAQLKKQGNELAEAKVQIAEANAQLAEAKAQIALLAAQMEKKGSDKENAEPARKINFFATSKMPPQEEVDAFKTAFEALNFESGGISLSAENQRLLEQVLPPMIEFAGLNEDEKQHVLSMFSPKGRRLLGLAGMPITIGISWQQKPGSSSPPTLKAPANDEGVSAAVAAEDSIRGLIRRYEEGLICRYSGGAATACMVDARAEAEEVVQRISAILQGRSESEAAAPTLHPKTNKPVGE